MCATMDFVGVGLGIGRTIVVHSGVCRASHVRVPFVLNIVGPGVCLPFTVGNTSHRLIVLRRGTRLGELSRV